MKYEADLILYCNAELGEGPCWDGQLLWWVDITGKRLYRYDPATNSNNGFAMPSAIGTVAPSKQGVVVALENGFHHFCPETGELRHIADPEPDKPYNRFNDGKCDPAGRMWAGTMANQEGRGAGGGALYCLRSDGRVTKEVENITTSNGIGFSPDQKVMYYIDTPMRSVDAFDFDIAAGTLSGRKSVIKLDETHGGPDGMTVDSEGYLWVAEWGGGRVGRWDVASGTMIDEVVLPAGRVTACAFGGPDCETLYITTAKDPGARELAAGGVFAVRTGARGIPAFVYEGI